MSINLFNQMNLPDRKIKLKLVEKSEWKGHIPDESIVAWIDGIPGGGGGDITVDSELSKTSTNPVQNKIITVTLEELQKGVGNLDDLHAKDKSSLVAAINEALDGVAVVVDDNLSLNSENPVQNKVLTQKINDIEQEIEDIERTDDLSDPEVDAAWQKGSES